ncbi:hypothetical protein CBS101457_004880 [Exobasidium rhododendri]|nr:hypothetical protein CBS101457_004880 [Exobasidium rhododendri]
MSAAMRGTAVNLVSVNTAPDRAKKVIGAVIEQVKDRYHLVHAGNSETIEGVKPLLLSIQPPPGILFCASMWTPEQQEHIQKVAKETIPGIQTHAIPTGLQVKVGPEGIVKYLSERIDSIMEQSSHVSSTSTSAPSDSGFIDQDDPSIPNSEALVSFRDIIPRPDHPRIAGIEHHTAQSWCSSRREVPAPAWLINRLDRKNLEKPYKGFSSDGKPDANVYHYERDEGAPVEEACAAASALLDGISEEERSSVTRGDVQDDDDFRLWSNPELYMNEGGIRLDESSETAKTLTLDLLRATLSAKGYEKVVGCTLTNGFLGQLVNGSKVLNRHSYNLRLFLPKNGRPSTSAPWGFSFFGHHLCIAVAFAGKVMVVGPTFLGAEPDRIDEGPYEGTRLFQSEEMLALTLMRSLSEANQAKARISEGMTPKEGLSEDRWNPFDERHIGGARQDNRIVPYEGCLVSSMTPEQREQIYAILHAFNVYLPDGPLTHRMKLLRQYEDQTYFAWIGKSGLSDPYYYRIQSPVTFCEFDFHCGSEYTA